ncbi:MAG: hypothetical protein EOO56_03460 [Hymenobacter sp.]|nr:MAG: hypothetical protein EOO56_03460 [Hymenobacter sp.]
MKSLFACSFAALSLTSCLSAQEPTCTSTAYAPIVSAIGPKTAAVNQPVAFVLGYALGSDCGAFSSVVAIPSTGNVLQIGVMGVYNGCACNSTTTTSQTSYQFQASTPGTYLLQFLTTNNTFITDTVVVK